METQPRRGELRGLKLLVGGLGALVILGTALVIGVIIHRLYAKPVAPSMMPAPDMATQWRAVPNRLPAGDAIKAIAAAGEDVAVWVSGPAGDQILLVSPDTGKTAVILSTSR